MKLTKRALCTAMVALGMTSLLLGCGEDKKQEAPQATNEPIQVGIVTIVEHPSLDASIKGIVEALQSRGYEDGKNIKIDIQNAQGDQSNLHNIVNRFVSNKDQLIFAVATPSAQAAANATKTIPIVATAVTNFEVAKLVDSNDKPGRNVTGVSDINPVADQLGLLVKLVPHAKRVGVIYNASEINSDYQVKLLEAAAKELGVEIVPVTVTSVNDIQQATQSLIGKIDALYVPTDNVVVSGLPALLKITNGAKLPVITGEGNSVKQGALGSIAVDYYTLGQMTGNVGADILEGKAKPETTPVQIQKTDRVIINQESAKALGITIPESLKANLELVP